MVAHFQCSNRATSEKNATASLLLLATHFPAKLFQFANQGVDAALHAARGARRFGHWALLPFEAFARTELAFAFTFETLPLLGFLGQLVIELLVVVVPFGDRLAVELLALAFEPLLAFAFEAFLAVKA